MSQLDYGIRGAKDQHVWKQQVLAVQGGSRQGCAGAFGREKGVRHKRELVCKGGEGFTPGCR